MRTVVVIAALVGVLAGCAPRDPVAYAHMVCGGQDQGLMLGSDEHAACVKFPGEAPAKDTIGYWRRDAGACDRAPDSYEN